MTEGITPLMLSLLLRYDAEEGELFWLPRDAHWFESGASLSKRDRAMLWNGRFAGQPAFTAINASGYRKGAVFGKQFSMHRVAWALAAGDWPLGHVDHVDGNKLNNRLANLRDVPRALNQQNMKMSPRNSSGVTGVTRGRRDRKWEAFIGDGSGGRLRLGYFYTFAEAVAARRAKEKELGYSPRHGKPEPRV